MCSIALALGIGSTVVGAVGQIQEGKATAQAEKYNSQVAEMNAQLADRQAKDAIERGQQQEQQKRLQTSQLQGKQRAAMAANGVDLSFGSPLDTIVDTAKLGEVDALNIRTNAYREAYDDQVQGVNYRANATLDRMKGESAEKAGYIGALGTVLGGAGKAIKEFNAPGTGY
ncbi:MAG TPA: hypothetical protein VGM97_08610 [Steroidobacteraceae bacterium]